MNCPICKEEVPLVTRIYTNRTMYRIECDYCTYIMQTEWYETEKEAWEEWEQFCEEPNK